MLELYLQQVSHKGGLQHSTKTSNYLNTFEKIMKKEILFLEEQQLEYQQHLELPLVSDLLQIEANHAFMQSSEVISIKINQSKTLFYFKFVDSKIANISDWSS